MNKKKQLDNHHSKLQVPAGKVFYNGTRVSVESILKQYAERRAETKYLDQYSYLPRESLLAVLAELGRLN